MKILWIHQYFATPDGWGSVRSYQFTKRIVQMGHEVDVLCTPAFDPSLGDEGNRAIPRGVRILLGNARYHPKMGFASRVAAFLRFMVFSVWHVLRQGRRYDLMVASSTPLTVAVPACLGRLVHRVPYVFEVRDVWPDAAIAAGVLRNSFLQRLSFLLEKCAYTHASAIVACSAGMAGRINGKLADWKLERPVATVSNCCDLDLFPLGMRTPHVWHGKLFATPRQLVVLYTGAMGASNAISDIVEAVDLSGNDERIAWWFAGDGCFAEDLKALAGRYVNVRFFGGMSRAEVARLYLAADVNLVTFMHEPLFSENSPNKFFDGIAAGLPAVFNRSTWLEPWLEQYQCGFVCKRPRPAQEIVDTLLSIAAMPEWKRRELSQNARRLAEEVFNRDDLAQKYLGILQAVHEKQPVPV